jgi:hypothetical protein
VMVACGEKTVSGEDFYAEIISLSSFYLPTEDPTEVSPGIGVDEPLGH